MRDRLTPAQLDMTLALHASAPQFIEEMAERIAATHQNVVGFTSTFQQNAAGVAATKHIKRLAPQIVTVLGGANCDGEQGAPSTANFPFVDYVVRG